MTKKIEIERLKQLAIEALLQAGLEESAAKTVTKVYLDATLRGQGHHDIGMLPNRLKALKDGTIKARPQFHLVKNFGAIERHDADNGLGELACDFIMKRACALADSFGIGLATISHCHHNLANAPYVDEAARAGYLAYLVTRGAPTMGAPERAEKVVGTSPMGFATQTEEQPISHDVCMAYLANTALAEAINQNQSIPDHWGLDDKGQMTTDPTAVQNGTRLPIGSHKGFGLAILGEILTGVLSGGQVIDQVHPKGPNHAVTSHTAIAIDPEAFMSREEYLEQTGEIVRRMQKRAPGLHVPGQNSYARRSQALAEGKIDIEASVLQELEQWCHH